MTATPRHYQRDHMEKFNTARREGIKRFVLTSATGTGKTNLIAWSAKDLMAEGIEPILIVGHTDEIIGQCYQRVGGLCQLDELDIAIEQGNQYANREAKVIVSSIQTLLSSRRLDGFQPRAIILDECHHYLAPAYQAALSRLGAFSGETLLIGFTATAGRGDKKSIFAYDMNGLPTLKTKDAAKLEHCIFERLVSEYSILEAVEQSWLTPIHAYAVQTKTDISDVKETAGDLNRKELQKKVDAPARTSLAIDKWEELAKDRPTIVFCSGVDHAHHAAEMWEERGYRARAVDGTTEKGERRAIIQQFQDREIQVLCNMGVATEGFDAPPCSCIVHLRPTTSETLYIQMSGRGLRPLPGTVDAFPELHQSEERRQAIADSVKPDCLMIDMVDITNGKTLRSAAGLIGLPPDIDLQGHSLIEVRDLLAKYEERQARIIGERPATFDELEGILVRVDVLAGSGAKTAGDWRSGASDGAYYYDHLPPTRKARLEPLEDGSHRLELFENGQRVARKRTPTGSDMKAVFDYAVEAIETQWPKPTEPNRGTWRRFTQWQQDVFISKLHLDKAAVDVMPYQKAKAILDKYFHERTAWDRFSEKQQYVLLSKVGMAEVDVNAIGYDTAKEQLNQYFEKRNGGAHAT